MKRYVSATVSPNMGNVTLSYTRGNQWVNRAWIKGFCNQVGVDHASLVGQVWHFEYTPASLKWDMVISDKFFPPTSNTYSLSFVFDLAASFSYVGVVPVPTTINFGLMQIAGEGSFRLGTEPTVMGDPPTAVDLVPLTNYWHPL
jgi:hypothetical protein